MAARSVESDAPVSAAETANGQRQRAEQFAQALPPLLVAAERVAATVVQGVHGRRRVGQGEAFWQFRRYQPGDALNRIDWRQSARGRHIFVRENEWEAAQSVWLWRDASPSMEYGSARGLPTKRERADLLLLATTAMLLRAGERVAMLGRPNPPASSRATLTRFALELVPSAATQATSETGLPAAVPLPRYGRVVLIGDFLQPIEEIRQRIGEFAGQGVTGHLLQILDPAELALPFKGRVRFEGLETEGFMLARRAEAMRGDYIARLEGHRSEIAELCRLAGWTFGRHATDQTPESALLNLYAALAGPGRR